MDNDKLFKFYAGWLDYLTFTILFKFFRNAVNKLVFYDAGTSSEKLTNLEDNKFGPKRSLTPEHEIFLYWLDKG